MYQEYEKKHPPKKYIRDLQFKIFDIQKDIEIKIKKMYYLKQEDEIHTLRRVKAKLQEALLETESLLN